MSPDGFFEKSINRVFELSLLRTLVPAPRRTPNKTNGYDTGTRKGYKDELDSFSVDKIYTF
jgi:hypothetical protein